MAELVPFDRFLAETAAARPEQYAATLEAGARRAGISADEARAEFERMRQYVLSHYEGVTPAGSHLDTDGRTIDCIPFDQQPPVRAALRAGHKVARDAPPPREKVDAEPHVLPATPRGPNCPPGTVPWVRVTLDQLVRHGTLNRYFQKPPLPPADGPRG